MYRMPSASHTRSRTTNKATHNAHRTLRRTDLDPDIRDALMLLFALVESQIPAFVSPTVDEFLIECLTVNKLMKTAQTHQTYSTSKSSQRRIQTVYNYLTHIPPPINETPLSRSFAVLAILMNAVIVHAFVRGVFDAEEDYGDVRGLEERLVVIAAHSMRKIQRSIQWFVVHYLNWIVQGARSHSMFEILKKSSQQIIRRAAPVIQNNGVPATQTPIDVGIWILSSIRLGFIEPQSYRNCVEEPIYASLNLART